MPRTAQSKVFIGCMTTVVAVLLLIGISISVLRYRSNARFARVEDHLARNQASLAEAVRIVIEGHSGAETVVASSLPPALAAADVKYALCGESHISLIVQTSPDTQAGYRVWIGGQSKEYLDRPTSIPNVLRFRYCNDYPESSSNRPR